VRDPQSSAAPAAFDTAPAPARQTIEFATEEEKSGTRFDSVRSLETSATTCDSDVDDVEDFFADERFDIEELNPNSKSANAAAS